MYHLLYHIKTTLSRCSSVVSYIEIIRIMRFVYKKYLFMSWDFHNPQPLVSLTIINYSPSRMRCAVFSVR